MLSCLHPNFCLPCPPSLKPYDTLFSSQVSCSWLSAIVFSILVPSLWYVSASQGVIFFSKFCKCYWYPSQAIEFLYRNVNCSMPMPGLSWPPSADSFYTDSSISLPFNCEISPYRENLTQFTDCPVGYRYLIHHSLAGTLLTSDLSVHVLRAIKQWRS